MSAGENSIRAREGDAGTPWENLFGRRRFGVRPGLATERALLNALGNPQNRYPVIHVAGTNGKGSTCALIASILSAAGLRVGLFTSPHLVRFNERYRVDGEPIADDALRRLVGKVETQAAEVEAATEQPVTFFECSAAIAFDYFLSLDVDVAVIEVGLGGRFDATNVVTPAVSVITRISREHTEYLGESLEAIAGEKAGIIKPGVPVVCGANPPEAAQVVSERARALSAPCLYVPDVVSVALRRASLEGQTVLVESLEGGYGQVRLPLLGAHQLENLATAVAAVEVFGGRLGAVIEPDVVKRGVSRVSWPGRLTRVAATPPTLVDGAHNPAGAEALAGALKQLGGGRPVALVIGMCRDKEAAAFARALAPVSAAAWTVPVTNERSYVPVALRDEFAAGGLASTACDGLADAVAEATAWAREHHGIVCVTGSLFLAGEALVLRQTGESG